MTENNSSNLSLRYSFNFNNNIEKVFDITLDSNSYIVDSGDETPPEWALLKNVACPNCPLDSTEHTYCPLAKHLAVVINFFQVLPSYQEVLVKVESNERTTYKDTTVQVGVGSLMGVIMSCSGCPIIGKLRSLARFHVPFAQLEETEYRVISMYVFAQYLKQLKHEEPDWDLKKLKSVYEQIQIVNKNLVNKLSIIEMNDTSRNAVVTLSNFAEYIMWNLESIETLHLEEFIQSFNEI
jgi:hypothetical protein